MTAPQAMASFLVGNFGMADYTQHQHEASTDSSAGLAMEETVAPEEEEEDKDHHHHHNHHKQANKKTHEIAAH